MCFLHVSTASSRLFASKTAVKLLPQRSFPRSALVALEAGVNLCVVGATASRQHNDAAGRVVIPALHPHQYSTLWFGIVGSAASGKEQATLRVCRDNLGRIPSKARLGQLSPTSLVELGVRHFGVELKTFFNFPN